MALKTVIITQARIGSTRLPGKVLLKVAGKTFLQIHAERLQKVPNANELIIATSINEEDTRIVDEAKRLGITSFRGSEQDVLSRYYQAAKSVQADIIVRVTSDCPFIDSELIEHMINYFKAHKFDYISNTFEYTYPDGIDIEVMSFIALEKAFKEAKLNSDREHVTPFIQSNSDKKNGTIFKAFNYLNPQPLMELTRLTLDEPADLEVITTLINDLGTDRSWQEYHHHLINNPMLNRLNNSIPINEGYAKSLKNDETNRQF